MTGLLRREAKGPARVDRLDRMFDEWRKGLPAVFGRDWLTEDLIRVDEYHEDGTLVIRAELPGIDPDKDVELTVSDGTLCIEAEHRAEEKTEERGYIRHELRRGSFSRTLPLPAGVTEADIEASYKDGILEIRIPTPEPAPATKIPIAKA